MVETTEDRYTVSVCDEADGRIEVEIVSGHGREVPDHFEEKRRWTYSEWSPGLPSPSSGRPVREIVVGEGIVVVLAVDDRRLWVYEAGSGVVRPIPVTNFYNELMLLRRVRDPAIALRSDLLFRGGDSLSDEDLRAAFVAYNTLLPKVRIPSGPPPARREGILARLRRMLASKG